MITNYQGQTDMQPRGHKNCLNRQRTRHPFNKYSSKKERKKNSWLLKCPSQDQHPSDSGGQGTRGSSKSVRKAHTKIMCSASGQSMAGKKWVIWNICPRSLALLTRMCKVAWQCILTTSSGSSFWRLPRNGGALHLTPLGRQSWGRSHSQPWLCFLAAAFQVGHFSLSASCLKYCHHNFRHKCQCTVRCAPI